jgi:hypothetical protein
MLSLAGNAWYKLTPNPEDPGSGDPTAEEINAPLITFGTSIQDDNGEGLAFMLDNATASSAGYVYNELGQSAEWGSITGTLSNQTDLQTALSAKANLAGSTNPYSITNPFTGFHKFNERLKIGSNTTIYDNSINLYNKGYYEINNTNGGTPSRRYNFDSITTNQGGSGAVQYQLDFPAKSGTIAVTSDIPIATYQTTAPTEAIADGGIHIVYLSSEPATKYSGYIYMIAEA